MPADDDRSVHVELRHGGAVATRLGAASDVESSRDGRGVWLLTRQDSTHCTLGRVGLDSHPRRPARPVPCESVLIDELPAGLLVYVSGSRNGAGPYSALVTANGAFRRLPQVVDGVAGGDLVLSTVEPGGLIALTDLGSGVSHQLRWPSTLQDHVMGLIDAHPEGRLVSVAFYPAHGGAEQTLDLWLLDIATRGWRRLPDMPLRLGPSKPRATWTADGRLLLLAGLADDPASGLVALWRPGQPRMAIRRVRLPEPGPPSGFRFVIW